MACCQACEAGFSCEGGGNMSGVDGGECDKPLNFFVWPSEVDALKKRLLTVAEEMDLGVLSCKELPIEEAKAWRLFMADFRAFATTETPTFGSYNVWTQACSYAHTIDGWHEKLSKYCSVPGPGKVKGASTETLTAVAWIAGAVIAVALVVGIKGFIPPLRLGRRR